MNATDGTFEADVLDALYPPSNADREYIAALLWSDDPTALLWSSIVKPEHLEHPEYAAILETLIRMRDSGEEITQLTVATEVGPALEPLVWGVTTFAEPARVGLFAEQVMRRARRRTIADSGYALTEIARASSGDELEKKVEWTLDALADETPALNRVTSLADGLDELIDGTADPVKSLPTPWPKLTRSMDGFRGGSLYTISGETGSGKSALALQAAYGLAEHGKVLYASMEMPAAEVRLRVTSQQTSIYSKLIEHRRIESPALRERLASWRWHNHMRNLMVVDETSLTVGDVRRLAQGLGQDLVAVVVDQLSLMDHEPRKGENESTTLARTTQALKNIAMDLDIPVILLTQLNREGAKGRPSRNHLFGSSGIGNAADVILILWRENIDDETDLTVLIDKNRQGPPGFAKLNWVGEFFRADDPTGER